MGRVWLARDEVLHRDVAIKEVNLPIDLMPSEREELRVRTLREARTAAQLSHPHVVQIYDVLGVEDRPWIVMEYIRSESLQQILQAEGPRTVQRAAEIGLAILRALSAAHSAGVLHRDVKPGNVLIADDGRVVLTDFGLATFDGGEASVTRPGLVWGSPEYVAPERAKQGVSSVEADLWSLGATLYAAVEGASPFARSTAMASLTALATEKAPPPQHAGALKPAITGLLRKDPRARLRASEVERILLRVVDGDAKRARRLPRQRSAPALETEGASVVPIPSYSLPEPPADVIEPAGPSRPETAPRTPGRRGWFVAAAVVLLVAAFAAAAILISDRGDRDPGPARGTDARASTAAPVQVVVATSPRPGDLGLATGWTYYEESGRFRMSAPIGWRIERDGTVTTLHEPDGGKILTINRWPTPAAGALDAARAKDAAWRAGRDSPPANYARIELYPINYFTQGVKWEYTFDAPSGKMLKSGTWFVSGAFCYELSLTLPEYDAPGRNTFLGLVKFSPSD